MRKRKIVLLVRQMGKPKNLNARMYVNLACGATQEQWEKECGLTKISEKCVSCGYHQLALQ